MVSPLPVSVCRKTNRLLQQVFCNSGFGYEGGMADGAAQVIQSVDDIRSVATAVRTSRGAPSQYKPEFCPLAHNLALLGKSDEQIAVALGISYSTIIRWMEKKKDFRLSVARARDAADGEIAKSLFERAKGYSHPAVKIFPPRAIGEEPVIVPYVEHYPPDTGAASFWLRNREPAKWKERVESQSNVTLTLEALVLSAIGLSTQPEPLNITPTAIGAQPEAIDDLL